MAAQYRDLTPAQLEWLRQSYKKLNLTGPSTERLLSDPATFDALPLDKRQVLFSQLSTELVKKEVAKVEQQLSSSTVISAQENAEIDALRAQQKVDQLMAESLTLLTQRQELVASSATTVNQQPNTLAYVSEVATGNSTGPRLTAIQTSLLVSTEVTTASPNERVFKDTARAPLSGDQQQAIYTAAEYDVRAELLKTQGVAAADVINTTVSTTNGVATITTADGRSIRVPQDEYDVLVRSTVLDAQFVTNYEKAYQEWTATGSQQFQPNSPESRNLFSAYVDNKINNESITVVDDPRAGNSVYAKGTEVRKKIVAETTFPEQANKDGATVDQDNTLSESALSTEEQQRITGSDRLVTPTAESSQATPTTGTQRPVLSDSVREAQGASRTASSDEQAGPAANVTIVENSTTTNSGITNKADSGRPGDSVRPNPLDAYTSYTYAISLFMMSKDEFNIISQSAGGAPRLRNCLIASAGRSGNTGANKRNANFNENFFFDELRLNTLIGLNATSQGTNLVEGSFTIIEPMGLSLLDRLIVTAAEVLPESENHLAAPYMMQIDFYDAERGKIPNTTKFIPMRLIECKIKVAGARGSEYRFKAVPYNHHAMMNTVQATPANFEVTGRTLQEFFKDSSSNEGAVSGTFARDAQSPAEGTDVRAGQGNGGNPSAKYYQLSSYVEAFNAWQQFVLEQRKGYPGSKNTIRVEFHPDILQGQEIVQAEKMDPLDTAMATVDAVTGRVLGTPTPNTQINKIRIRAGTSVTQVINMAMKNSRFVRDQIPEQQTGPTIQPRTGQLLKWWKIVPTVELKQYDRQTEKWWCKIVYYVVPYDIRNTTYTVAPMAEVGEFECVKEYNYIYTGKNTNVIDLQIDFDFLYYTSVSVYNSKSRTGDKASQDAGPVDGSDSNVNKDKNAKRQGVNINSIHLQSDAGGAAAGAKLRNDYKSMVISNLSEHLYSRVAADMLVVKMRINGDPEFIKQDEIFVSPARTATNTFVETVSALNNSLPMDSRELMVRLVFKVPSDIDERTGKLTTAGFAESRFTGIYRVLNVDNEFKNGKFEQTLEMVRYFNQLGDPLSSTVAGISLLRKDAPTTVIETVAAAEENSSDTPIVDQQIALDDSDLTDEGIALLDTDLLEPNPFAEQELELLASLPTLLEESLALLQNTGSTLT